MRCVARTLTDCNRWGHLHLPGIALWAVRRTAATGPASVSQCAKDVKASATVQGSAAAGAGGEAGCRSVKSTLRRASPSGPTGSVVRPAQQVAKKKRGAVLKRRSSPQRGTTLNTSAKAIKLVASVGTSSCSTAATAAGQKTKKKRHGKRNVRMRVCVLNSSYDGADSATAAVDNFLCTPEHYMKGPNAKKFSFEDVSVKKIDSYRTIRELVTSGKYDVFFNLCDGGRDEKRAGVDVVEALEELNAAFTGTDSRSFEPSKVDMKLLVGSSGVNVPNFVLLKSVDSLAKKCRHLRFPVIVKHLSGYASVGINKDNRCDNLDELKKKVKSFINEYNHALVEEFIRGKEGTVLTCADSASPFGVRVFRPLMFHFLKGSDDFAYFEKKWGMECNDEAYGFLSDTDPAYTAIIEMARHAYTYIMNGVGYGRVDFRIDERTGQPYFLEINPNCGMWYSEKDGGDFADIMVKADPTWSHEKFVLNAVSRALRERAEREPWYIISHDKKGQFSTRASKTVPAGKCLFGNAVHPIPVVAKSLYRLGTEDPSVGCVICRGDGVHHAVAIRHSCEPNMQFMHGRTLLFASKRPISVGEELTVDYATLRDERMPHFACSCGTQNCRSVIFAMQPQPRIIEVKAMKKLLREKKRLWQKEKRAEMEAEKILTKRSNRSCSGSSGLSGTSGSGAGSQSSSDKK